MGSLVELLGDRFVVLAGSGNKRIAFTGLRSGNSVLVEERLQLRFSPAA